MQKNEHSKFFYLKKKKNTKYVYFILFGCEFDMYYLYFHLCLLLCNVKNFAIDPNAVPNFAFVINEAYEKIVNK